MAVRAADGRDDDRDPVEPRRYGLAPRRGGRPDRDSRAPAPARRRRRADAPAGPGHERRRSRPRSIGAWTRRSGTRSRTWPASASTHSRSCAARAPSSGTTPAASTSTRPARSGSATSATAAPSSPRRPRGRCASSPRTTRSAPFTNPQAEELAARVAVTRAGRGREGLPHARRRVRLDRHGRQARARVLARPGPLRTSRQSSRAASPTTASTRTALRSAAFPRTQPPSAGSSPTSSRCRGTTPRRWRMPSNGSAQTASPRSSASPLSAPAECCRRRRATSSASQEICRANDVLLIADEVITGFGRLGEWFGSERFGLQPGPRHRREGPHLRLRAARRGDRERVASPSPSGAADTNGDLPPRLYVLGTCGRVRGRACEPRRHRIASGSSSASASSSPCSRRRCVRSRQHELVGEVRTIGLLGAVELTLDGELADRVAEEALRARRDRSRAARRRAPDLAAVRRFGGPAHARLRRRPAREPGRGRLAGHVKRPWEAPGLRLDRQPPNRSRARDLSLSASDPSDCDHDLVRRERQQRIGDRLQRIGVADTAVCMRAAAPAGRLRRHALGGSPARARLRPTASAAVASSARARRRVPPRRRRPRSLHRVR